MELLFVIAPGIIATSLLEKLKKQRFTGAEYLKHMTLFDLFSNFLCVFGYHYVYRSEVSVLEAFNSDVFLVRFVILNVVCSIVLSVGYFLLAPKVDVESNSDDVVEEESDNE